MKIMIWFHFRKDAEVVNLNSRLEDEQSLVAQLQRKIKELMVRTFTFFIFEMCFSLFHVAIKDCMCSNPGKCLDNCNSQNVHHRWTYFLHESNLIFLDSMSNLQRLQWFLLYICFIESIWFWIPLFSFILHDIPSIFICLLCYTSLRVLRRYQHIDGVRNLLKTTDGLTTD
jgi:hypothetical protein